MARAGRAAVEERVDVLEPVLGQRLHVVLGDVALGAAAAAGHGGQGLQIAVHGRVTLIIGACDWAVNWHVVVRHLLALSVIW